MTYCSAFFLQPRQLHHSSSKKKNPEKTMQPAHSPYLRRSPEPVSSKHNPLLSIPVFPTTPANIHKHSLSSFGLKVFS